jgi:hypothetical protein
VARIAQALGVAYYVLAAFGQGLDVVALHGQRDSAISPALSAQRISSEQLRSQLLQFAARDPLDWLGALHPRLGWV